jgi:16S rRNA A1518/A1519 N6-dimethyltransferase RsmA/KsgA/DIM1 with predicted DNA glycosylase/AP lyase activity
MTALARIRMSSKILEPSAGFGAIVDAIHRWPHGEVHAIELNEENCRELRDRNCTSVYRADFLRVPAPETRTFDRVIMNPPRQFSVEHVIHASLFLAPGGRLVALLRYDAAEIIKNHNPDVRLYSLPRETFLEPGKEGGFVPSCILVADVK